MIPGQHPIVILKDVSYEDLDSVVQFMYNVIVNVSSDKLPAVLKVSTQSYSKALKPTREMKFSKSMIQGGSRKQLNNKGGEG